MFIVGYARVSTSVQAEAQTIDIQIEALAKFAVDNGHTLIDTFKDDGVSGSLENRPGLAELLAYIDENTGKVDGILVYKLDRLARDLLVQETLIREFAKRSVKLISTKEPDLDGNDPSRKMIRQLFGAISEYERALITMRLSAGRLHKASKGGYGGGGIAIGYKSADKDLIPDVERQEVVREIYRLRSEGWTLEGIADHLTASGIPTPRKGKRWYSGAVSYILHNEVYRGMLKYKDQKVHRADLITINL